MDPHIVVHDVSKKYGEQTVLDHISVEFHAGNIYCITGKNGTGKTVFLKCLCGLSTCTEGTILINGKQLQPATSLSGIMGVLIERPGFLPNYSALQNLCYLASLTRKPDKAAIQMAIQSLGLDPNNPKKVGLYSLGMKQRLGIAQAIMEDAPIVILDEPMNGLDKSGEAEICTLLQSLKKQKKIVILAMHLNDDYTNLCDQIYAIDSGKLRPIAFGNS